MLAILYEDAEIVIVDKPAGLASQPGEGVGLSVVEVFERDFSYKPYPVHRLDKGTAGCLVIARNSAAARVWSQRIATKAVGRGYEAICFGIPGAARGTIESPVSIRGMDKSALTRYRIEESFPADPDVRPGLPGLSRLALELGTGRGHQIRIHLASIGLPILGDDKHGNFAMNRVGSRILGARKLMLWAARFRLPDGNTVTSETPEHLKMLLARLRGRNPS